MVKCCKTISFFRPIVIYNLTLNFISPLETQLSSFRFVVIGRINIHLYNSNTHVNSSQYWSGSGCSFSLNVYRKRELYSSAALTSVFCRKHIVIDGYDSEIIWKPGYLILPKKKKKIQYAVQESNIKIWVALCWFSLFRNLYTFRRYDRRIMTFITFIFPLSWQNVHTFITKEREITQYNRDTGQTFGVACIHMVARRLRLELAEVSDNIDICTDKISSNTRVFW